MRYLGIDYGARLVGVAISDPSGQIAFPLKVLKNNERLPELLADLARAEGAERIVMGESLTYSGQANPVMAGIKRLEEILKREFNLEVYLEPEWLTSREAEREIGADELLHARAAAIILRSFLERQPPPAI